LKFQELDRRSRFRRKPWYRLAESRNLHMSEVTLAVYNPPGPGLPFLGVAILPSGAVHVEPYETAEMAEAYLDRATKEIEAFAEKKEALKARGAPQT
jgi:hypothetical protein